MGFISVPSKSTSSSACAWQRKGSAFRDFSLAEYVLLMASSPLTQRITPCFYERCLLSKSLIKGPPVDQNLGYHVRLPSKHAQGHFWRLEVVQGSDADQNRFDVCDANVVDATSDVQVGRKKLAGSLATGSVPNVEKINLTPVQCSAVEGYAWGVSHVGKY